MRAKSRALFVLLVMAAAACATRSASVQPGVVARMWHARVLDARAEEYYAYLTSAAGIPRLEQIPGNLGVDVLTRSRDGVTEFIVISYWRSLDDIKAYAGADIEKVHNLPRDAEFLIEPEANVRHFTVRVSDRK